MILTKEISVDGKNWRKEELYSFHPLSDESKCIIAVKNVVIWGFKNKREALKYRNKAIKEMEKISIVMQLAGFPIKIYYIRDVEVPEYEQNAIDVEFEVMS